MQKWIFKIHGVRLLPALFRHEQRQGKLRRMESGSGSVIIWSALVPVQLVNPLGPQSQEKWLVQRTVANATGFPIVWKTASPVPCLSTWVQLPANTPLPWCLRLSLVQKLLCPPGCRPDSLGDWYGCEQPPPGMGVEGEHTSFPALCGEPQEDAPHVPSIPKAPKSTQAACLLVIGPLFPGTRFPLLPPTQVSWHHLPNNHLHSTLCLRVCFWGSQAQTTNCKVLAKPPNYNVRSEHLEEKGPLWGRHGRTCVCVCVCVCVFRAVCVCSGHTVTKFCFQPDISKISFQHRKNVKIVNENSSLKYRTLSY